MTAFICCLLTEYIVTSVKYCKEGNALKYGIMVSLLVFILTCEKNIYKIMGIDMKPFFSLATIHIFILAFFLVLYMGDKVSCIRLCVGGIVSVVYILCMGNAGLHDAGYVRLAVTTCMVLLSVYGFYNAKREHISIDKSIVFRTGMEIGWIALFTIIFVVTALYVTKNTVRYIGNGFLSSVMSFGGGDAYLTLADGLFVHTELISEEDFYNYLVPIVNILPGSILCKTLSGMGYFIGFSVHGKVWEGVIVAIAGFFVSLLASCGIFYLIGCFYSVIRELYIIREIRKWIRPIVAGLMITVLLSLVWQNIKLGNEGALGKGPVLLMLVIYVADLFMIYKVKMKNGSIVFLSAIMSFIVCNLMMGG